MLTLPNADTTDDMLKSSKYISVTRKKITIRKIDLLKIFWMKKDYQTDGNSLLGSNHTSGLPNSVTIRKMIHRALKINVLNDLAARCCVLHMIIEDFQIQAELAIHGVICVQSDLKQIPVLRTSGLRLVGGRIFASL